MATISLQGETIHTYGNLPAVGSPAPDFHMAKTDLSEIRLSDCLGKCTVLNIFPSLDTPTCAMAMKQFNKIAGQHDDVLVLCVSADLPFAQKRFCNEEHLKNVVPVSIFRNSDFGKIYGVLIADGPLKGLLSRAVVVIDKSGKITYTEQVQEIAEEPDYQCVVHCFTSPKPV